MKCPPPDRDPRYARQLPIINGEGQTKLYKSRVAVVGLGGLGSIVSQYLAAAGIGHIKIIDSDLVDVNNLNRQLLYDTPSIGLPKAPLAARRLKAINPCIKIEWFQEKLDRDNIDGVIGDVDLIVDCLDNWEARLQLDEYSQRKKIPLLHAAVESFYGQVFLSIPGETACLKCIAPTNTKQRTIPVLGAIVGVIASIEASIAIKHLLGLDDDRGTLIIVDMKSNSIDKIPIDPGSCPCQAEEA
ncbi:MAG: HesA/MoeB/ThiF family protein [Desulfurococcales archaeon]|nr:HesA/MoeB/ThiF family protein [Desulfurococcales archaeon]